MGIFTSSCISKILAGVAAIKSVPFKKIRPSARFFFILSSLFFGFQNNIVAQCNNAVTSGGFTNIPTGIYTSVGGFLPGNSGDLISIVENLGSRGAHIKRTLNYSLRHSLGNLTPSTTYTLTFDYSLLDGCQASAQTSFRVEIFSGTALLQVVDVNATNGGDTQTIPISFTTPPGVTSITLVFTDPNSNRPSCGAVIDNLFILSTFTINTTQTNVTCFNQTNGSFTITGTGGAGAYAGQYSLNGGSAVGFPVNNNTATVNNLAAGSYLITLTDANGCPVSKTIAITQPSLLTVTGSKTEASCAGSSDGSASLTVGGGTAPYTYLWSNGSTSQNVTNLPAGAYSVTVTDTNGCAALYSLNIFQPAAILISTAPVNPTCSDSNNGSISLSVSGGTAPYTYSWSNGSNVKNQTGIGAGDFTVTITDAKGCTSSQNVTLSAPPAIILSSVVTGVVCSGSNTGTVDLSISGGTAPYSYIWSNGSTIQDLYNLGAGSYSVAVTDSKNCSASLSITITEPAAIVINATSINVSCAGSDDGSISLTTSGGTGSYSYLWNTGATSNNLSGLAPGSYSVTVTDQNGCKAVQTIAITESLPLSLSTTQTNVNCFGSSTGAINLTASGGTAPYSYAWQNTATGFTSTSEDLSALPAGSYNTTVTDANGCVAAMSVTITQNPAIILSSVISNVKCFGGNTGVINLSVNGGIAPYTYSWTNTAATTQDLSNLTAGNYSATVTDANGCTAVLSLTVTQPASDISISGSVTNVTCFGGNNGGIEITVSGGTAPYTYNWSNGRFTGDINGLTAASFSVTVTDANSCTQTQSFTVAQPAQIQLTFSKINPTCVDGNDGSITLNQPTGGNGPYSYSWTKDGLSLPAPDLNALSRGNYQVTVTDQSGCSIVNNIALNDPIPIRIDVRQIDIICAGSPPAASISIDISGGTAPYLKEYSAINDSTSLLTITDFYGCTKSVEVPYSVEPPIIIESSHVDVKCFGDNTGSISIVVSGGNGPYQYIWSDDASINESARNNLTSGTYTIRILDNTGCELNSLIVDVLQPAAPLAISQNGLQNVICPEGSDGSISVNVTGGTGNYSYLWSNGATTKDLANLSEDSYTLTVTDANLCQETLTVQITAPQPIVITRSKTDITCNNASDGSISLSVQGGTGSSYTYSWNDLSSGPFNLSSRSGLSAGTYNITVTDEAGCNAFTSVTLNQPEVLTLSTQQVDVNCFGEASGSAIVEITGGTSPYTYLGNPVSDNFPINNLAAGLFSISVSDENGCEATINLTITQPVKAMAFSAVSTSLTCKGENNGSISLTGDGGTGPYTYLWSNGATTPNLSGLTAGTYSITITDEKGCSFSIADIQVSEPAQPLEAGLVPTATDCFNGNSGSIDLSVSGGTAPYRYLWSNGEQTEDISNLQAGNYEVTVIDANNCQIVQSVTVDQPASPISVSVVTENVVCFAGQTGEITVIPSGGTAPYTIKWSTGEETTTRSGLAAGTYSAQVVDNKGCRYDFSVRVTQPPMIVLNFSKADNLCAGGNDGSAEVSVFGGTAPYSYVWSNGETGTGINNLSAGTYSITVTDANNCVSSQASVTISDPEPILITVSQKTDINCFNDNSGSISIMPSGGTGQYQYQWSNGATSQNISGLYAGTYSVTVTDQNGCSAINTNIILIQPDEPLMVSSAQQNVTCNNGSDGSITLNASGGTPGSGYSYLWEDGSTTAHRSNLISGLYAVITTDSLGCSYSLSVFISQPNPLIVVFNKSDAACFGESSGSVQIMVSGGTPAYSYAWKKNGTSIANLDLNALSAGSYELTVTDSKNCTPVIQTIVIGQPASPLTITATKAKDVSCNGGTDGAITITAAGGTPDYTFSWTKNGTAIAAPDPNMLSAGIYIVSVSDLNGCSLAASSVTIAQPAVLVVSASATAILCNGGTATVAALASGGTENYSYSIDGGVFQPSPNFAGVLAGDHLVTVNDQNNCSASYRLVIQQPEALQITITTIPLLCPDGSTSESIVVGIIGGTEPYTIARTNVSGNNYQITVTDANGCSQSGNVVLSEPDPMIVELSQTNVSCRGFVDGEIILGVTGGASPYSYSLDANDFSNTTGLFQNLAAGEYAITIKDVNGCTVEITVKIASPESELSAAIAAGPAITCFGESTTATVTVSGGTPGAGYSYLWNTLPAQTTATASGLLAGTYTVTITDANGCTVSNSVTITQPEEFILVSKEVTNPIRCYDEKGTVTLKASGGAGPVSYTFNGETNTTGIFSDVAAGTALPYLITDNNGCSPLSGTVDVTQPAELLLLLTDKTDANCFGTQTGSIIGAGANGTAPYFYSIDGINFQADDGTFNNLAAGNYTITLKDANDCVAFQNITINQPEALVLASSSKTDASCNGKSDGSVTAGTVTNAVGTISYSWENASGTVVGTTATVNSLPAGTYTLTVFNNCSGQSNTVTINEPQALVLASSSKTDALCNGANNGSVTSGAVINPVGSVTYSWKNAAGTEVGTTQTVTNLKAGTYTLTVSDNCSSQSNFVTINEPTSLNGTVLVVNTTCKTTSDGKISVEIGGGAAPYRYTWNNSPSLNQSALNNIIAGDYAVMATDANGCTISLKGTVLGINCNPAALNDDFSGTENTNLNGSVARNDSDPDGDSLKFTLISQPENGTIIFNQDGSFIFLPAPGWSGSTGFEYEVCDTQGACTRASVTIVVNEVNTPPVAGDDQFKISAGISFDATVTENDYDADGDTLRYTLMDQPANGTVIFNADGSFTYTPNPGFSGQDLFTYRLCDPSSACDEATVTLITAEEAEVNLTPDFTEIPEGNRVNITAVLNRPVSFDVTVTLAYGGDAQEGKDYDLLENFITIIIPVGKTQGDQYFVVSALIDDLIEKPESVLATISKVSSSQVRIGTGAEIVISDILPPVKGTPENENPDIKPDPLLSPNGDGQGNDRFLIGNIEQYPNNRVLIFNRWGNEVYRTNGYNNAGNAFEGVANTGLLTNINKDLPEGVYYYLVYTTNADGIKKLNKGYLILKR